MSLNRQRYQLLVVSLMLAALGTAGVATWTRASARPAPPMPPAVGPWRDGDVLLVRSRSAPSAVVLAAGPGLSAYSHCGIIQIRDAGPMLLHAAPQDDHHVHASVVAENLHTYLARPQVRTVEVLRHPDPTIASAAAMHAARMADAALPFDGAFDWASDDRVYCTELVCKAYERAGAAGFTLQELHLTRLRWIGKAVVLPGALTANESLSKVDSLSFSRLEPQ